MGAKGVRAHVLAASLCLAVAGFGFGSGGAQADTLEWALVQAYQNNPSLNAQRASLRATDESVPQALSGYRPKLSLTTTGGYNYQNSTSVFPIAGALITSPFAQNFYSRTVGATGTYTVFNGFQTANRTRQAESQVDAARETLRVTEQQVLLDAATAYMNLLRDQAVLDLQRRNVEVLTEQLKQTRDRFNVGEVTRTDVAQAESRLAAGRSQLLAAQSQYITSRANYRRVIGVDPGNLAPGTPVDRLSPNVLRDRARPGAKPLGSCRGLWRRCCRTRRQNQRRRALSESDADGQCAAGTEPRVRDDPADATLGHRSIVRADLPGRGRVFGSSSIQRNARPAATQSRHQPRPGAGNCGAKLGTT